MKEVAKPKDIGIIPADNLQRKETLNDRKLGW